MFSPKGFLNFSWTLIPLTFLVSLWSCSSKMFAQMPWVLSHCCFWGNLLLEMGGKGTHEKLFFGSPTSLLRELAILLPHHLFPLESSGQLDFGIYSYGEQGNPEESKRWYLCIFFSPLNPSSRSDIRALYIVPPSLTEWRLEVEGGTNETWSCPVSLSSIFFFFPHEGKPSPGVLRKKKKVE